MIEMLLTEEEEQRLLLLDAARERPRDIGLWVGESLKAAGYAAALGRPAAEVSGWLAVARDG